MFALASTVAAVGLGEGAVRWLMPAYDPAGQVRLVRQGDLVLGEPGRRARQSKNTGDYDVEVRFGPRGFRDPRDVASAGASDLLVVGDSFAFGWGVEEEKRWSNRLEALTGRRTFNIAIPGQSIEGYDRLLRHARALGARPVRLIVSLCMENDIWSYPGPGVASVPAAEVPSAIGASLQAAKFWLAEHSALYGAVTAAVHRTAAIEALAERAGLVQPNLAAVGARPVSGEAIAATADRLAALAAGYETTVLLVPARGLWLERSAAGADRVHRAMVAALAARGLAVADPRAAFEAWGDPLRLHFAADGHWNELGHRLAAEFLAARFSPPPAGGEVRPRRVTGGRAEGILATP